MAECGVCSKEVGTDECMQCGQCKKAYHFECSQASEVAQYRKLPKARRVTWKCSADCKTASVGSTNASATNLSGSANEGNPATGDIEKLVKSEIQAQGARMKKEQGELKTQIGDIEKSQSYICDQYDDIIVRLNIVPDLQKKIQEMEAKIAERDRVIFSLLDRVKAMEQYSRDNNFEIRGVPQTEGENVEEIAIKIARKLDVVLEKKDIQKVHRTKVSPGRNTTPSIVVKVVNHKHKEAIMAKQKKVITKAEIVGSGNGKVFRGDHLSAYNKNLIWLAKLKAKELNFEYVWWQGKVLMRENERCRAIVIKDEEDLLNLHTQRSKTKPTGPIEQQVETIQSSSAKSSQQQQQQQGGPRSELQGYKRGETLNGNVQAAPQENENETRRMTGEGEEDENHDDRSQQPQKRQDGPPNEIQS